MRTLPSTPVATFPPSLRTVLMLDAATCIATGALLALGRDALAGPFALPAPLLAWSGASLFPIAAFMLWVATRSAIPRVGAWLVIGGNVAWVVASAVVSAALSPSPLGLAFLAVQAIAVAILAGLETLGLQKMA